MKKILLIQSQIPYLERLRSGVYLPLGILSLSKHLIKKYEVKIFDLRLGKSKKKELISTLNDEILCIGISSLGGLQIKFLISLCKLIKKIVKAPIIIGGPIASQIPE